MGWIDTIGQTVVGVVLSPIIVPIAIAEVIGEEMSKKKCRWCTNEAYKDGLCRSCYREEMEEKREEKREKKRKKKRKKEKKYIKEDIETFKITSQQQIQNKYDIQISFDSDRVDIDTNSNGKIIHLRSIVFQLEKENIEIQQVINDLQSEKNAI